MKYLQTSISYLWDFGKLNRLMLKLLALKQRSSLQMLRVLTVASTTAGEKSVVINTYNIISPMPNGPITVYLQPGQLIILKLGCYAVLLRTCLVTSPALSAVMMYSVFSENCREVTLLGTVLQREREKSYHLTCFPLSPVTTHHFHYIPYLDLH